MTKFKKLFFGGLAFILTLSMVLQSTPAFAMGSRSGEPNLLPPGPVQMTLADIKSMVVLEMYPLQLKITGTLPSPCYQLKVYIRGVSPIAQKVGASTLSIWVGGVVRRGVFCVRGIQTFATTVTLDPAKLGLAPGKYMAMVNPVNGQSQFKKGFTVPASKPATVLATITEVALLGNYPPQFKISGSLPSPCYTLLVSAPQVSGRVVSIFLRGVPPHGMLCIRGIKSFTTRLTLDRVKLKLAPGSYTLLVNPVNGVSRFKLKFFVGID